LRPAIFSSNRNVALHALSLGPPCSVQTHCFKKHLVRYKLLYVLKNT